jgi:hypothetical protein
MEEIKMFSQKTIDDDAVEVFDIQVTKPLIAVQRVDIANETTRNDINILIGVKTPKADVEYFRSRNNNVP